MTDLLITIDGPAGAGKTSVSRRLADILGYRYVDTGALYRGIAVAAKRAGVASDDDDGLAGLCEGLDIDIAQGDNGARVWIGGEEVTSELRTPEITMMSSAVSARPVVRKCLLEVQRRLGASGGAVFEGRDMGTVVFPAADVKFFLSATPEERARRRYLEIQGDERHAAKTYEDVLKDMNLRDRNDSSRALAPLKAADDAVVIDSTGLGLDEVLDRMTAITEARKRTGRTG
ncbi:MAG: (d)CMP kinase [Desulfatibacillaceae bacterium]